MNALRSVQAGVVGSVLDIFRQDIAMNAEGRTGQVAKVAQQASSQLVWAPIVTCAIYAVLKVIEGNPGEIVQGVEVSGRRPHCTCWRVHALEVPLSCRCG